MERECGGWRVGTLEWREKSGCGWYRVEGEW